MSAIQKKRALLSLFAELEGIIHNLITMSSDQSPTINTAGAIVEKARKDLATYRRYVARWSDHADRMLPPGLETLP